MRYKTRGAASVLCLIKHENECFEYSLKYDYKRILIRMNHYIIILIIG